MKMITATLKEWGNSTGIILPSKIVKSLELKKGEEIVITIVKKNKLAGFGMFKGSKSFEREENILDRDMEE